MRSLHQTKGQEGTGSRLGVRSARLGMEEQYVRRRLAFPALTYRSAAPNKERAVADIGGAPLTTARPTLVGS